MRRTLLEARLQLRRTCGDRVWSSVQLLDDDDLIGCVIFLSAFASRLSHETRANQPTVGD